MKKIKIWCQQYNDRRFPVSLVKVGILALLVWGGTITPGYSHRVSIYAWIEGGSIVTQSKFSGGKRVYQGAVEIFDDSGEKILSGTTDEEGVFSFSLKTLERPSAIKVIINAGMGHQAHWQISEAEVAKAIEEDSPSATGSPSTGNMVTAATNSEAIPATSSLQKIPSGDCLDEAAVKVLVEQAMDRKLTPIMELLISIEESRAIGVADIMAGLGYIFGLAGLGALIYAREKK